MSRDRKTKSGLARSTKASGAKSGAMATDVDLRPVEAAARYAEASNLASQGQHDEARRLYADWAAARSHADQDTRPLALIHNDLAVTAAVEGRYDEARTEWQAALEIDPDCLQARLNRDLLDAEMSLSQSANDFGGLTLAPAPGSGAPIQERFPGEVDLPVNASFESPRMLAQPRRSSTEFARQPGAPVRVAILSLLFNWPSTGGGNHHTAEMAQFLGWAGYDVRHFFAQYPSWRIGRVADNLISPSELIAFDDASWNVAGIQARFRHAVDGFAPDFVIITDSWNMKPLLAEAVRDYPFMLLYQAQENLCPLNNLRLLASGPSEVEQCPRNQLAMPQVCCRCLAERGPSSGALHRAERELAGVGTREYDDRLRRSLGEAEVVMVLNPVIEAMMQPYARRVCIVPWGMDASRFPWPPPDDADGTRNSGRAILFMAAVAGETIKGYHVAHEACRILRQARSDFELVVTFDPAGPIDDFTRSVGWCSLADLPRHYRAADICLVPTIAQDSLSRTSVEAMASGIPVVASRIGGLPYTVTDGLTGLLFEPGNAADLAEKIARLLDDPDLRRNMGLAGRKRFEADFVWEDVIERYFKPLFSGARRLR